MDLYLIRHGQSTNNRGDNHVDFPSLTDLGCKQAYLAGKVLKDVNPVKLYCSPMLRAVQTAQKVGSEINLDPQIIVELHEGGGIYTLAPGKRMDGLKRSEIYGRGMAVSSGPYKGRRCALNSKEYGESD